MEKNCCHSPLSEESAKDILKEKGINRTRGKIKILQLISKSDRPLSAPEIHSKMKESCDLSTIFRTITQFKEKHLLREVNLDEGFLRYELTLEDNSHHHHHVRCRICGEIKNLEHCDLSAFEKAIRKLGYAEMEHKLEFTGVCSSCSDS